MSSISHHLALSLSILLLCLPSLVSAAASFTFALSTPIQCSNMTVTVQGGSPPYQLIIIPTGTQNPEYRKIISMNFTGTTQSFNLAYNTDSTFVALMSDATGFGTGGTGTDTKVSASDDSSCLSVTTKPEFYFYMSPSGYLSQCSNVALSWSTASGSSPTGDVTFYGIIPGGESFLVTPGSQPYSWQMRVRAGTSVTLFAGDSNGPGTGGSAGPFVVNGTDSSCIDSSSPSSTAGSPAGAVTGSPSSSTTSGKSSGSQTSSSPGSSNTSSGGGGGSSSKTGPIVGGVIGGLVFLAVVGGLLVFCLRRRRRHDDDDMLPARRRRVDLAEGSGAGGDDEEPNTPPGPPMIESGFYHPEPFVVPEIGSSRPSTELGHGGPRTQGSSSMDLMSPTTIGSASAAGVAAARRERRVSNNTLSSSDPPSSGVTPGSAGRSTGRLGKGAHPPSAMRAVNFVQHEDAGAVGAVDPATGEQVLELPPTYDAVRTRRGGRSSANGSRTDLTTAETEAATEAGHGGGTTAPAADAAAVSAAADE
ncbi:hypothetical protein DL93DRAFT_2094331 [Clavulina sp. PMI_390]|nr:hypothetical protein DL93DRAFT_2094331 [Clavulina sp. PMI_390]